ncbi:hypothetical protein PHMEG_00034276 [Phytophthora megakarya]|uniref:Uncharacterized protein n=1 Tax=Phytophthora megakarya TaxID=4795 RepID=A0A225URR5_9STRA|nr:hypothetical protein PHMEG_00034276 [Phytophthora megakarya]
MEVFQHGQREEIARIEAEISTFAHDVSDDPEGLRAQVLQLRTKRNAFECHAISARKDLHHAEADRDRLSQEATQAGDEIRDLRFGARDRRREIRILHRSRQQQPDLFQPYPTETRSRRRITPWRLYSSGSGEPG